MNIENIFFELTLIIFSGLVGGLVASKFKLPLILGYLFGGFISNLIIKNLFGLNLHSEFIDILAEIGIALLLFTAGIEFSISSIIKLKKLLASFVGLQTVTVIFVSIFFSYFFKFTFFEATFLGSMFAMSSTTFVLKLLEAKKLLHSLEGKIIIGVLLSQDILIIFLLLFLNSISPTNQNNILMELTGSILKTILLLSIAYVLGKKIIPSMVEKIAISTSKELILFSTVGLSILFGFFAEKLGISYTLGSFLAGLVLSETFLKHEIFFEVKPLRDLFTMFFFVSIGGLIQVDKIYEYIISATVLILILISTKVIVGFLVLSKFKINPKVNLKIVLTLSQISEFAFVGITMGLAKNWIDVRIYNIVIISTVTTMALTPLLFENHTNIFNLISKYLKNLLPKVYKSLFLIHADQSLEKILKKDHTIICGFGKVGQYVAKSLDINHIPYVIIDNNPALINVNSEILIGDSADYEILEKADTASASLIIICLPESSKKTIESLMHNAKKINPTIKFILRAKEVDMDFIHEPLIKEIIEPDFETAVRISAKVSAHFGFTASGFVNQLRNIRKKELKRLGTTSL